jgi:hypothetical protein
MDDMGCQAAILWNGFPGHLASSSLQEMRSKLFDYDGHIYQEKSDSQTNCISPINCLLWLGQC